MVSIHSRPKAAAVCSVDCDAQRTVSIHSRPKAAGEKFISRILECCFNTQPPEGGCRRIYLFARPTMVSIHSRPKAAEPADCTDCGAVLFQYTAARRRLLSTNSDAPISAPFQYTAARRRLCRAVASAVTFRSFNTQPPEGGWFPFSVSFFISVVSIHSRPKAAANFVSSAILNFCFNTQPPEGG